MRLLPQALALVLLLTTAAGCNRGRTGPSSGNTPRTNAGHSPSAATSQNKTPNGGAYGKQEAAKPGSAGGAGKNQTHTGSQTYEPQPSVNGKPSAESDRGSSTAVGHQSVAEPGAPQGTAPTSPQH